MVQTNGQLIASYLPMSEPAFLILLFLRKPCHGYALMQLASQATGGRVSLGSSTVYTILYKMEQDGLIEVDSEVDRRKVYRITEAGEAVLEAEMDRLDAALRLAVELTGSRKEKAVC